MTSIALPLVARLPTGPRAVAWLGIAIGLLAAWIGLPPIAARTWVPSLVLGALAVAIGVLVWRRGDRRFGAFAVAAGIFGFGLAYLAALSGAGKLESVVIWSALLTAMLRYATPLVFASLGGMFSERAGVVNVGLEGMMLMGAFFAIMAADKLDSWWLGLAAGIVSGGAAALVLAFFAIHVRADQIVVGTAIYLLALGLTGYLFIDIYGTEGVPTDVPSIPNVHLGFVDGVPFFGDIFDRLNLMIWIAIVLVPLTWVILFKTPIGLRIRACGEHPRAADTVGINVYAVRYGAVVLSGMLAAAGGAYLSIGFLSTFGEGMTDGRGFIALAALIVGKWRPVGATAACLLIGFGNALADRLPAYSQSASELLQALPYVLTIIAVAGVIGRSIPPAAVGRPYQKQ